MRMLQMTPKQMQIMENKANRAAKRAGKHADYYLNGLNGPQAVARRLRQRAQRGS